MRFVPQREKGFSLIELTFAVTILAVGIMGYTLLKSSNRYSRQYSMETSQAVQLSMGQMEDFMIRGYDAAELTDGNHDYGEISADNPQIGDFQLDNATWTVTEGSPTENCKIIVWTGAWDNKNIELTNVLVDR